MTNRFDFSRSAPRLIALTALALVAAVGSPVCAQPAETKGAETKAPTAPRPNDKQLLDDFMHYTLINRDDLAAAMAQELLDRKMSNVQFVKLVEESTEPGKFDRAVQMAMKRPNLEPIAAKLTRTFEQGKLERARDPEQIAASIKALKAGQRARINAHARLVAAGEYAMPQLLVALLDGKDPTLQTAVSAVVTDLGRQAIIPLVTALPRLEPASQELVANQIARIQYRTSLPYLSDLADTSKNDLVVKASRRAIDALGGTAGATTAELYVQLAESYYAEKSELTSFPGEEHQILWSYDPAIGLVMTAIRTPVFHEAMAMRLAERALTLKPDNQGTLSLWIATNFKREIQTPAGYANPAYPMGAAAAPSAKPRREAMYYAVAAGAPVDQQVLARAIDTRNSQLARKAIAAIEQTAGGAGLWGGDGRHALLEALSYPNRRVQYEAALALAVAQPREAFNGAERVMPTLSGAIRDASSLYAVILAANPEAYQALRKIAEKSGFKVLPMGKTLGELAGPIAEAPAIDIVIVQDTVGDKVSDVITQAHGMPKTAATPVLALTSTEKYHELDRKYDRDDLVAIRQTAIGEEMTAAAIKSLIDTSTGGAITAQEAAGYSTRALAAMRDLAVSGNKVVKVDDAVLPLIAALGETAGATRLSVADVLSRIGQDRAQRALMDAALAANGDERISLLGMVAGSAKRFGNHLETRQTDRLLQLATSGADAEATSAAALTGALNLPNRQLAPLILQSR